MQNLYNAIDRKIRDYIWGGCALSPEFETYRDNFEEAAAIVAGYDSDESLSAPETGYTPEGERLIQEIVTGCVTEITPRVAMRESR